MLPGMMYVAATAYVIRSMDLAISSCCSIQISDALRRPPPPPPPPIDAGKLAAAIVAAGVLRRAGLPNKPQFDDTPAGRLGEWVSRPTVTLLLQP
jgi:hypothetical protein